MKIPGFTNPHFRSTQEGATNPTFYGPLLGLSPSRDWPLPGLIQLFQSPSHPHPRTLLQICRCRGHLSEWLIEKWRGTHLLGYFNLGLEVNDKTGEVLTCFKSRELKGCEIQRSVCFQLSLILFPFYFTHLLYI